MTAPNSGQASARAVVFGGVLLLGLTVLVGWAVWTAFSSLEPGVAAAAVTAAVTLTVSIASLVVTRVWERRRAIEEEHRLHKLPIYEEFLAFWFRALMHEQLKQDEPSELEMATFLSDFTQRLTLWGSEEVLREYGQFRLFSTTQAAASEESGETSPNLMFKFEHLLLAIRRDLGHSNKDLADGDLLRLWINDIDDFLPHRAAADRPQA